MSTIVATPLLAVLLVAWLSACQPTGQPDGQTNDEVEAQQQAAPVEEHEMTLSAKTMSRLRDAREPAIFAVRCDGAETLHAGTRSETTVVAATLLAAGVPEQPEEPIRFQRFADSFPAMEAGKVYLVAAMGEMVGAWTPLEAVEIDEADAADRVQAAMKALGKD